MKTILNILFLFSFCSFWIACSPEPLDISIPQADPKLVVYSQALPSQGLVVSLSKSFAALNLPEESKDTTKQDSINNVFLNQFLVENALVTISGPDFNDTIDAITKGVYLAPFFPFTPNNIYTLSAYDPASGFSVNAATSTFSVVEFDTIFAKRNYTFDSLGVDISYKVNDPAGDNYYLVNVYADSIPESNFFSFTGTQNTNSVAFSDREYPTGQVERDDYFEVSESDTLIMTLTNISKEYFEYIKARERNDNSFLSEPVTYPSNVNNGLGFFNIHLPSARLVTIED